MPSSEGSVPVGLQEEYFGVWVANPEVHDVVEEPREAPAEYNGIHFVHADSVIEGLFGSKFEGLVMGQSVFGNDFAVIADRQLVGNANGSKHRVRYLEDCSCGER
jgi:hypothetical protein